MKLLNLLFFLTIACISHAQNDVVYMSGKPRLISTYQILFPQGEILVRETYTAFKGQYWMYKKDTVPHSSLQPTDSGYMEKVAKKPVFYKRYAFCDSAINIVRNGAFATELQHLLDSVVREKIGHDNKEYMQSISYEEYLSRIQMCPGDFREYAFDNYLQQLTTIDSIYAVKVSRMHLASTNPQAIDSLFVAEFMGTFNYSEPDYRTLERIISTRPQLFMNAVSRLSHSGFISLTLKLDEFPPDVNLSEAKAALKQLKERNPEKRQILRKMKNKKA